MGNIQKGSKVPFTLTVDANSMGGSSLKDSDFKVDFYAQAKNSPITGYFTVLKADATKDESDDNIYYMVCETETLDLGTIGGTLEVTYTDPNTSKEVKEIITITTDVKIVERQQPAPQAEQQEEGVEQPGE
jgi:hypothetical protein